jgi:hypothetical protein
MDHVQIKSNQIAASYVANGLDERTQEEFELHMMGCPDCLSDVEAWRAVKLHIPRETMAPRTFLSQRRNWWGGFGLAASVVGAMLTAVVGWYARGEMEPDLATKHSAFFSAPALTRSDDCTPLRYAPDTRSVILRVPRVASDQRVVATDVDGIEHAGYSAKPQADGAWILQFKPETVQGRAIQLETRAGNASEPIGCITGEAVSGL